MAPFRVLHVITRFILGGAQENTLLTVIGQARDPRFDVTLYSGIDLGPEGNLHDAAYEAGVNLVLAPHMIRPIRPRRDWLALADLHRFIREGGYHVVHTHSSKAGIIGRTAARLARTPVVVHTLHGQIFHEYQEAWKNRLYIAAKKVCAPMTDALVPVCDEIGRRAVAEGIGRPGQYRTIYSGFDGEGFRRAAEGWTAGAARASLGLPPDAPVVGKVARIGPLKGQNHFVEMAQRVAAARPDVRFLLVGDGVTRAELEADIARRGLTERFLLAGLVPREEVPRCIRAMDVLVHASVSEGIARVIPQAYCAGRPVVAWALDGAPEVVRDEETGYAIPPLDADLMARRVLELLDAPDRREAMARRGREFVMERFTVERMVRDVSDLHLELLAAKGLR